MSTHYIFFFNMHCTEKYNIFIRILTFKLRKKREYFNVSYIYIYIYIWYNYNCLYVNNSFNNIILVLFIDI